MDFGLIKGDEVRFLHQAFITDTIANALHTSADIRLYYANETERARLVTLVTEYLGKKLTGELGKRFAEKFAAVPQEPDRWGARIEQAFVDCFGLGYNKVVAVGSRTPTLTTGMFETAFKMLGESDAVFGPTPEGRYFAIGMAGAYHLNLAEFQWKSPTIYSEVANTLSEKGLHWSELGIWYAVESPEDLELMARDINQYRFEGDEDTCRETELVMERILAKL